MTLFFYCIATALSFYLVIKKVNVLEKEVEKLQDLYCEVIAENEVDDQ